jgi:putative membrane protein
MTLARLMAGVAVIALIGSPALAQNKAPTTSQQQMSTGAAQQLAQEDMDFAKKAAGDGMAEVMLGTLAKQNAENDQVKEFGQRMVDDHSKANDKLKSIAETKKIELPKQLPADAQQAYDELQKKKGHDFDQAYMEDMVKDHKNGVELFQKEAKDGKDQDLQKFAQETLPTLQQHLDVAQKTQEQVSASATQAPNASQQAKATSSDQPRAVTAPATAQPSTEAANKPKSETTTTMAATGGATGAATGSAAGAATSTPSATASKSAQQAAADSTSAPKPMTTKPAGSQQAAVQPTAAQVKADDVIGAKVVNNKGDKIGKIEDLVIDKDKVQYAVVSVGGFLGIGAKQVVVPIDQLKLGKDQAYLMSAETQDQLKQMPEYKEGQYKSQKQG